MSERVKVGTVDDLPEGSSTIVDHDDLSVGVFNVDGAYYAIENRCAHQGGPVCKGKVQGKLGAEFVAPGERVREFFEDEPVVACPWHGWEYELRTGEHVGLSSIKLRTFDVTVEDDELYLEV